MSRGALQKTLNACGPLLINKKYLDLASASAHGPQGWTRNPFEKPWHRNKSCRRLGSRPKRSI